MFNYQNKNPKTNYINKFQINNKYNLEIYKYKLNVH